MDGFYLLCAHLVGDFVIQNDWMASWKGKRAGDLSAAEDAEAKSLHGDVRMGYLRNDWFRYRPFLACTVHCLLYTAAVAAFSWWWMPWWGLVACFAAHWPIDRYRLAGVWMRRVSGQTAFADGPFSPWSVIVVDNTFHLLTLAAIALAAGR